jgi:hypothetical protein
MSTGIVFASLPIKANRIALFKLRPDLPDEQLKQW